MDTDGVNRQQPVQISVVIPCFNNAEYLPAAVQSIADQSCPVHEIIVVDDGSTDNTAEVVSKLDTDIVYIEQQNAGPSAARNTGIHKASGSWIAFLDADDQWTPDKTALQLGLVERYPELVLVAGDMAEIGPDDVVVTKSVLGKHGLKEMFTELQGRPIPDAVRALLRKNFIPTGTVLAKRSVLLDSGCFNTKIRYGEDLELWLRIAMFYPIACLPDICMLRRRHAANVTRDTIPLYRDLVVVMEAVREWGSAELRGMGMDPDAMVARAWAELGYCYFTAGDTSPARAAYRESLREAITVRAVFYYLVCLLPDNIIGILRSIKQRASGDY